MGKDDKQRRKGASASSSRAAELLQSSGLGIQFLNLGNDPSSLEFPGGGNNDEAEEFGDVDPEWRIAFRKLNKREANTREKGLKSVKLLIQDVDPSSKNIVNEIKHFVKFYNYLVFDSVSGIRILANEVLAAAIIKLRKQIAEHVIKMLPSTLLSIHDQLATVRKSATELLVNCFGEEQRKKIYENTAPRTLKICFQVIQKRNNLVTKQKFEDIETLSQRSDRIMIQAFAAIGDLREHCPNSTEEIFKTLDGVYDSVAKMGTSVFNSLLLCILNLIKHGLIGDFMRTNISFKILKLLDSENDILCKNAFGIYLFMADYISSSGEIDTLFSKKDFIDNLILRMVAKKGRHFNALEESLLPLIIIAIKYDKTKDKFEWILELIEAFFENEISDDLYPAWFKTYIDVSDWLCKSFLPNNPNDDFSEKMNALNMKFVGSHIKCTSDSSTQDLIGNFILIRLTIDNQGSLPDSLINLLINDLPSTSPIIEYVILNSSNSGKPYIKKLAAKCMISNEIPKSLFQKLLQMKFYENNSEIDLKLLSEKLLEVLKSSDLTDEFLECYKFLQSRGFLEDRLNNVVDLNASENLSQVIRIFSKDTENFSSDEQLSLLKSYISVANNESNPWTDQFLAWMEKLDTDKVHSLIIESYDNLRLSLFVKLILLLDSSKLNFNKQQRDQMSNLILKKIFAFNEVIDQEDFKPLNTFLEEMKAELKPFVKELFDRIEATNTCNLSKWFSMGQNLRNLPYIANSLELSPSSFEELTQFMDSTFSEQILFNETMLVAASLSTISYQAFDSDRFNNMIKMLNMSTFYMSMKSENTAIQLYIAFCYSMLKVYVSGEIIQNEVCRQISIFIQYWDELVSGWNMTNVCERFVYHLIGLEKEIPFSILFTLRQLNREFEINTLVNTFSISVLDNKQKLRAISSLTFNLPHELLPENDYLHFVNALERTSEKLKNDEDQIDIALITLADLRNKIEIDNYDGLYTVSEDDSIKSALSAAVMRICSQISHVLPDIDSSIRDFVLCGLITAAENFSTNLRSNAPIRLLSMFALKFFVNYDNNLTKLMSILTSSTISSVQVMERRSKVEAIQHEWREFFGASMANYLMAWFCWSSFTEADNEKRFPEFFRIQVCKFIHNADPKLGLFNFVQNPEPILSGEFGKGPDTTTKDIFDTLVNLLFSEHTELQLTAVHILHSELVNILSAKVDTLGKDTEMILALRDSEEDEIDECHKDIEYKLFDFFSSLLDRLHNIDWAELTLDPWLTVADLLLRIIRLLDSQAAAAFCSNLEGETIYSMLYRVCSYISFNEDPSLVKKFALQQPASFFALHKDSLELRNKEMIYDRLISLEGYSCWLYRRSLETLPAVVREWFDKVKDNRLKSFTQQNISPILIANEMKTIGSQSHNGFSMRARPNTREIAVKYKVDEASLELTLTLPEDYPLSRALIEHDKRKILSSTLTNTLHKNLFAFINNRNGSLLEGINQWRRGVEKTVEGAEDCSICLMTVSSSNYRLPDMRCKSCKKKFHSDCMLKWIRTSSKPSCPLCRADFC